MSPEYVLAAAPEHIFIAASSWAMRQMPCRAGLRLRRRDHTARACALCSARAGAPARDPQQRAPCDRDGPGSQPVGLDRHQYIAKQLHPDAFADIDPVVSLRRYHEQFLPVTFEGTWMARVTPARA